jgi:hypothetical protein
VNGKLNSMVIVRHLGIKLCCIPNMIPIELNWIVVVSDSIRSKKLVGENLINWKEYSLEAKAISNRLKNVDSSKKDMSLFVSLRCAF